MTIKMTSNRPAHDLSFSERLYLQLPVQYMNVIVAWILLGGMLTIAITRYVFSVHYPKWFINDQPTISKTSAFPPADTIFAFGMDSVAICIVIAWTLGHGYNNIQIKKYCPINSKDRTRGLFFNNVSWALGIVQGLTVFLAATVNLEVHTDLHIIFSIMAFGSGALVFISDSFGTSTWRKYSDDPIVSGVYFKTRRVISVVVIVGALWYLYLWLNKNSGPIVDVYVTQIVYVISEHIIVVLSYSYAPLYLFEVNRFRRVFHM